MMSAPVAMAECGASRNMPERGRRGTEDELPLLCFEGRAETAHIVHARQHRQKGESRGSGLEGQFGNVANVTTGC